MLRFSFFHIIDNNFRIISQLKFNILIKQNVQQYVPVDHYFSKSIYTLSALKKRTLHIYWKLYKFIIGGNSNQYILQRRMWSLCPHVLSGYSCLFHQ